VSSSSWKNVIGHGYRDLCEDIFLRSKFFHKNFLSFDKNNKKLFENYRGDFKSFNYDRNSSNWQKSDHFSRSTTTEAIRAPRLG